MTIDWTKPLQMRNGCNNVRVICINRKGNHPVVVLMDIGVSEEVQLLDIDGADNRYCEVMNVPEKRTIDGWINVYAFGVSSTLHLSREAADNELTHNRIACVYVSGDYEV